MYMNANVLNLVFLAALFVKGCTDVDLHQSWPSNMDKFAFHLMHPLCSLRSVYLPLEPLRSIWTFWKITIKVNIFNIHILCFVPNSHRFSQLFFTCLSSMQVNSDVVFYARKNDGTMEPVKLNQTHVGRMILTKAAGSEGCRDLIDQYKFPEGQWSHRTQVPVLIGAAAETCFLLLTNKTNLTQGNTKRRLNWQIIVGKMQECKYEVRIFFLKH